MGKRFKLGFIFLALLSFTLTMIFGLTNPARNTYAAWSGSGDGTSDNPYQISTKAELEKFRDIVNGANGETRNYSACAKLIANIDLNNEEWAPIGTSSAAYEGVFDGNNKKIQNLSITDTNANISGLFGFLGVATIKNVSVYGTITAKQDAGGIAGKLSSDKKATIINCSNYATINCELRAGGIVGQACDASISKCTNYGSINVTKSTTSDNSAGGIVGRISVPGTVVIEKCSNQGEIIGKNRTGGIVGEISSISGNVVPVDATKISNCYNIGYVKGPQHVGGIIGYNKGTIEYCFNYGDVVFTYSEYTSYKGCIYGNNGSNGTITDNYYLKGRLFYNTTNSTPKDDVEGQSVVGNGLTADDFKDKNSFSSNWNFNNIWMMGSNYPVFIPDHAHNLTYTKDGATITATCDVDGCTVENGTASITLIAPDDLEYDGNPKVCTLTENYETEFFPNAIITYYDENQQVVQSVVDVGTYTAKLQVGTGTNTEFVEIELVVTPREPMQGEGTQANPYQIKRKDQLEEFRDIVNGLNNKEKNNSACAILVKDIDLAGDSGNQWTPFVDFRGTFDGDGHTISGLFISTNQGHVALFGSVTGTACIKNLTVEGSVTNTFNSPSSKDAGAAGIVAQATQNAYSGTVVIENCVNKVTVSGNSNSVSAAGIIAWGNKSVKIKNCVNDAPVTGNFCGGILAETASSPIDISYCYNTVNGTVGGRTIAGIAADFTGTMAHCYNAASVTGSHSVAGLVAYASNVTITNCYNLGVIDGSSGNYDSQYTGGIVGNFSSGTNAVSNCYNYGNVIRTSNSGSLVGRNNATVTSSYALTGTHTNLVGTNSEAVNDSKFISVAEFIIVETFVDWDFEDVWVMDNKYPVLMPEKPYSALDPNSEIEIKVPGDKEKADKDDILTVNTTANPVIVEWYYDDDNPDDSNTPIATGKTYTVKKPKDTGHTIVAVIKQNEDENGNPLSTPITLKTNGVTVTGELGPYFQVGDKTYFDFKEAYNDCPTNGVITLIKDYDTTGLEATYLTIDRDVILDVNGHKLSGSWVISIDATATLSLCNSKPETGGIAGGINYNSGGKVKVFALHINISVGDFNYNPESRIIAEGYEAITINQNEDPDENGYNSIVQPIDTSTRTKFEDDNEYNLDNEKWYFCNGDLFKLVGKTTIAFNGYSEDTHEYKFTFTSDEGTKQVGIVIEKLAVDPVGLQTISGEGTEQNPYRLALLTKYVALDTTKKIELPGFVKDREVLTVNTDATDLTIEWFYDDDNDGKPDSNTPVGRGSEYVVRFTDLDDDNHEDIGHTIIAVIKQTKDENGCEYAIKPTVITTPAKVSGVFPVTKDLAIGTIYLIGDYINVESGTYMSLNISVYADIEVKTGKYLVAEGKTEGSDYIIFKMFRVIYNSQEEISSLRITHSNDYESTYVVTGIRLVSGTGVKGDPYKFEAIYDKTYVDLNPQEDIVIKTPDNERNPQDGDELEIYTTANPVEIEWFYDDDNDGNPDDLEHPIATGKKYTVKCPDKDDPTHDDTGHTIITVIKQNKKDDGTDYPDDEIPTVTTKPVLVRGKTKEIGNKKHYLFGDVISLEDDTTIYTNTSDDDNKVLTVIKKGEYVLNRPDTFAPAQAPYETITFNDIFTDKDGNPIDIVIKFASPVDDIKKVVGIKCTGGSGTNSDPYLFVAVTKDDLYIPLDPTANPDINTPNHEPLYDGDVISVDTDATEVTVEWYYTDENGNPTGEPLDTGTTYTVKCPQDTGHGIIAVIKQNKKENGNDYLDDEKPTQYSKPVQVYTPVDPEGEKPELEIPGDKDKAEDGDEITIDTDVTPIEVEWFYDDDGDGNPDDPQNPIGTDNTYIVKCPDSNDPTHDDTGHTIIAVIKQDKKPDGTDYEEGKEPTTTTKPIVVKGNIGGYEELDPTEKPSIITPNHDPLLGGDEISIDITAKPVKIEWFYDDNEDGKPDGTTPLGDGTAYTIKNPEDLGHTIIAVITQTKDENGDDLPEDIIQYSKPVHVYTPLNPDEEIGVKTTDDKERPGNGDTIEVDTKTTPVEVKWYYDDNGDNIPDDPENPIGTGKTYTIVEPKDTGHTIIGVVTQTKKPDGTNYPDDEVPTIVTKPTKVHGYLPDEYVPLDTTEEIVPTVPNKKTLEDGDEIIIETDASDVIINWYYTDEDGNPTGEPIGEGTTYTLKCPDELDPTHDDTDHSIIAVLTQKYDENGDEFPEGEVPTQYSKVISNIVKSHVHNFTYTASGATITAKCNTPECDITEGLKLTLLAPKGSLVCDDKPRVVTFEEGYSEVAFGTPVIKYYKNNTEVTECINAGAYIAKVTVGNVTAQIAFTIEAWKPKTDVKPAKDITDTPQVKVEIEGAGEKENISVMVEVKTTLSAQETGKDYDKIQAKIESGEKITRVYDVKLLRTTNGVTEEIQPSDIKPGTKITVTMTLPEEVMKAQSFKILHIHSASDTEYVTDYVVNGNTVSFTVSRLSEFAFIIKANGLPGWSIALIVIDSIIVAMALCYVALFFIFNKWIVVNGKALRVFACGKKDGNTRVITMFLGIEYKAEGEVFNSKEEALEKLE